MTANVFIITSTIELAVRSENPPSGQDATSIAANLELLFLQKKIHLLNQIRFEIQRKVGRIEGALAN